MVPIRRHARDWLAHAARGGLGLIALLECSLKSVESQCSDYDFNENHKRLPPGHCYRKYEHPSEEEHRTAEQFQWKRERRLSLITAIAVIAAAVYAGLAFREAKRQAIAAEGQLRAAEGQLLEAKIQTEFSKQQTELSKRQTAVVEKGSRPYVLPVVKGDMIEVSASQIMLVQSGFPPICSLNIENFGSTPAIIRNVTVNLSLDLKNGYFTPERHNTDLILETKGSHNMNYNPPIYIDLSPDDRTRMGLGQSGIYLRGTIDYDDIAGTAYRTEYCFLQISGRGFHPLGLQPASGPGCKNRVE